MDETESAASAGMTARNNRMIGTMRSCPGSFAFFFCSRIRENAQSDEDILYRMIRNKTIAENTNLI